MNQKAVLDMDIELQSIWEHLVKKEAHDEAFGIQLSSGKKVAIGIPLRTGTIEPWRYIRKVASTELYVGRSTPQLIFD